MTIRDLRPDETRGALAMAARAFRDDPLFVHVYPDAVTREARFVTENAAYVRTTFWPLGTCEVAEVDGQIAGLALWLPPGERGSWWRDALCLPAMLRAIGPRRLRTVLADYQAFERQRPEAPAWYLGLLAVAPEAQGRGVGGALVRRGLGWAERDGAGVYLETGTRENVRFYQRCGLRERGPIPLPHGPTHWGMWRGPVVGDRSSVEGGHALPTADR